jgi:mono/diheme cytochrome c family protein
VQAQTPTWAEEIAPILYNNCTKCHHDGGIAPFALMEYSEAVSNSHGISHATGSGEMPPWPADPSYRHYAGERL